MLSRPTATPAVPSTRTRGSPPWPRGRPGPATLTSHCTQSQVPKSETLNPKPYPLKQCLTWIGSQASSASFYCCGVTFCTVHPLSKVLQCPSYLHSFQTWILIAPGLCVCGSEVEPARVGGF